MLPHLSPPQLQGWLWFFFFFFSHFLKNAVQLKNCAGSEDEDPNINYAHYGKKRPAVCDKCINTPLQLWNSPDLGFKSKAVIQITAYIVSQPVVPEYKFSSYVTAPQYAAGIFKVMRLQTVKKK